MGEHSVTHSIQVASACDETFDLLADVSLWPVLFGPTVCVEPRNRIDHPDGRTSETFQLTAVVGDTVRRWASSRELDRERRTIRFRQAHARAPLSAMAGSWTVRPIPGGSEVVLRHDYVPTSDTPASRKWIEAALHVNSQRELAAIGRVAAAPFAVSELIVRSRDTIVVDSAADIYEFVRRADRWPDFLPHVLRVELVEPEPDLQDLRMTVRTPDAAVHETRSIRLCRQGERIVYKQLHPPAGLLGHAGAWEFGYDERGRATAESRHLALIDPTTVATSAELSRARTRFASALSANSLATLSCAVTASAPFGAPT